MGSWLLLLMVFAPAVGAIVALVLPGDAVQAARRSALGASAVALLAALGVVASFDRGTAGFQMDEVTRGWNWLPGVGVRFHLGVDGISLWLVVLTALLSLVAVLVSWESVRDRPRGYYALLLALESGMLGVFTALDILLFYIFFEFTLIPLFFLIGIWGGPERRLAARKFFIFTLAGSVLTLLGLLYLVVAHHRQVGTAMITFSIPELTEAVRSGVFRLSPAVERWIFLALMAGFAIKVPLFPLHTWLPLAHVEAPTAGSVILAGVLLKIGTYGFLRFNIPLLPTASQEFFGIIAVLAIIGIVYGALLALAQSDIKKLIAYSSVSHLGFCMLGLFALNATGVSGGLLQMINHGLSTGALFALVGMLYERCHTRDIDSLGGLAAEAPVLTFFFVFMTLSSIGLPGLNGFIGEFLVLAGAFQARRSYAVAAALAMILGAFYMLWMVQRIFFGPRRGSHARPERIPDMTWREIAAMAPIALACLWIGLYPSFFLGAARADLARAFAPAALEGTVVSSTAGNRGGAEP